jgi:outer membrane protein TolC
MTNGSHWVGAPKQRVIDAGEECMLSVLEVRAAAPYQKMRSTRRSRFSILLLLLLPLLMLGAPGVRAQNDVLPGKDIPLMAGAALEFPQCVKVALKQSPNLTSSSLEIDLRRLDESDARFAFIPAFSLRTLYYINQPENEADRPYSIHFVTDTYNPIENYFSLQARKVLTQMGILGHLQVISDYLERLGMGFLELQALERIMVVQKESMRLSEQNLVYVQTRLESGGVSGLDLRVAEQEMEQARLELSKLEAAEATILEGLRGMLGFGVYDALKFNWDNAREQVLENFKPDDITLEEAHRASFDLRIQALKRELQEKNVTLAYTRFLPTFIWGVQTTDPFSSTEERGLFFSVGLELPLWDGLKRYHNVSRQKTILRQYEAESKSKEVSFDSKWSAAQRKLEQTRASLKLAQSQQKVAELKERQTTISYNAGRQPLPTLAADRKALLESRKGVLSNALEHDKAVLVIRNLSGDLIRRYVDTTPY